MHDDRSHLPEAARWSVRRVEPDQMTARDVEAWADLESRAAEPNAFLSPHFVIPAVRYIQRGGNTAVFLVERLSAGGRQTVGAGVFRRSLASRYFPLPHMAAYRCTHSFSSGVLLDRDWCGEAFAALISEMSILEPLSQGIEVPLVRAEGALVRAAVSVPERGTVLFLDVETNERSVLVPSEAEQLLDRPSFRRVLKDLNRRMRRLRELGEVGWRCYRGGPIASSVVDSFLALEHAGWKGTRSTSLRGQPAHEAFFREVVDRFGSEGRALLTELTLDGVPIAGSTNFVSGRAGFSFKIGWDEAFAAFSPGWLNEVEFIRHAKVDCGDLEFIDSGASSGSYIERLWQSRQLMGHLVVPMTAAARMVVAQVDRLRKSRHNAAARHEAASAMPSDESLIEARGL